MKKSLTKLLSSTLAFTLVLALSGSAGTAQMSKVQAEDAQPERVAAVVEEVKEENEGAGIIEALEEKMKEEAPVVKIVKAETPAVAEVAAPAAEAEEVVAPEIKAVPADEAVAPEVVEEAVAEWNVSATASDNVAMTFYADAKTEAGQVAVDTQSGVVRISGTGAMEESVYRHFMSIEKYLSATKALLEAELKVTVDPVYDETITDVIELDANIRFINHETGEEIVITDAMRMNLNPTDFLAYSPTEIIVEEGITNVSASAFICCGDIERVELPSTVKSVGAQAFQYCKNLREVLLPANTEIGTGAFEYCQNLQLVQFANDEYYQGGDLNPVRTLTETEIAALVR